MDFSKLNLDENQVLARKIVLEATNNNVRNRNEFQKFRNKIVKESKGSIFHNLYFIKAYNDLINEGKIIENPDFLSLIQKRSVRTMSGVAPVTVLTKAYPCPGRCIYCPTDVRMPKSYLPSQPAAQRGFRQRFNPYAQVFVRLKAMRLTGHEISKVELRVIGGTFSSYPKRYQKWFIKRCIQAMNEFSQPITSKIRTSKIKSIYGIDTVNTLIINSNEKKSKRFEDVIKENEKSKVKCIGINIETRPDFIDKTEIKRLRSLGVTKVEMGVQTVYPEVQALTRRGHTTEQVMLATKLLKDSGFKIGYHMMPNLPGSTPELDKEMMRVIFKDENYCPDYLKIYPCVVLPKTVLSQMFKKNEYKSYSDEILQEILLDNLKIIPEYCRVDRVARDLPSNEIESGFKTSNMRQILEKKLFDLGTPPRDIRSREIKDQKFDMRDLKLIKREYASNNGREIFISFEDIKKDKLIALSRLRFPSNTFIKELKNAALIREVHVYGKQIAVGKSGKDKKQHVGWGTKLMKEAEKIAKKEGFEKVAVIAGIGTREWYRKLGYRLDGTYMVRYL